MGAKSSWLVCGAAVLTCTPALADGDATAGHTVFQTQCAACHSIEPGKQGVGPSLALKILSGMGLDDLIPAIRKGDLAQLVKIPGVGRKTAERIVLELRDKLAAVDVPEPGKPTTKTQLDADVSSALINLGYDEKQVEYALSKAKRPENADFETLLRASLQILGGGTSAASGANRQR